MALFDRISIDPDKLGGKPCIRHLRIPVSDVLRLMAHGLTPNQVVKQLPSLELDDIRASLEYASQELGRSRLPVARYDQSKLIPLLGTFKDMMSEEEFRRMRGED